MTELEARKRKLELELAQVNDEISKEGEVAPEDDEKPADAGEAQTEPETGQETPADNPTDDSITVESLQAELKAKDEEISGLMADNEKLQSVVDAYYTAVAPEENTEGDA